MKQNSLTHPYEYILDTIIYVHLLNITIKSNHKLKLFLHGFYYKCIITIIQVTILKPKIILNTVAIHPPYP